MFKNQFQKYLNQNIEISNVDFEMFFELLILKDVKKGTVVLKSETVGSNQFFILSGMLVASEFDNKGIERVIQIAVENTWIGDLESYTHSTLANRNIIAAEDCKLFLLSVKNWNIALEKAPVLEKLFRILFQNAYINQTKRVRIMLHLDAKSRFDWFAKEYPNLINRVEWKTIASFLHMSPETLSRIKMPT
jgi:CRP/FNR family transcriptional regulator, anaerobic regulatory protein